MAIVFCGIFIESALHILIARKRGVAIAKAADHKCYEEKLRLLDCVDKGLFDLCKRYNDARREIVHEKAFQDNDRFLTAQDEAESAITLVARIVDIFDLHSVFRLYARWLLLTSTCNLLIYPHLNSCPKLFEADVSSKCLSNY